MKKPREKNRRSGRMESKLNITAPRIRHINRTLRRKTQLGLTGGDPYVTNPRLSTHTCVMYLDRYSAVLIHVNLLFFIEYSLSHTIRELPTPSRSRITPHE